MTTSSQVIKLFKFEEVNLCSKECGNCMDKVKQMKALSDQVISVFFILKRGSFYAKPLQEKQIIYIFQH